MQTQRLRTTVKLCLRNVENCGSDGVLAVVSTDLQTDYRTLKRRFSCCAGSRPRKRGKVCCKGARFVSLPRGSLSPASRPNGQRSGTMRLHLALASAECIRHHLVTSCNYGAGCMTISGAITV